MRATLVAALVLLLLAAAVFDRSGREQLLALLPAPGGWLPATSAAPAPEAPPSSAPPVPEPAAAATPTPAPEAPAVLSAGELSVLAPDAPPAMVRYVDSQGSVRMVRGMANVPAEFRADAVELGRAHVNLLTVPAPSAVAFRDWQPGPNPNRHDIVLFSATWCGVCERAKRYLDRNGVRYLERDIDSDAEARQEVLRILGQLAVPLLGVDGRYVAGFRTDVYDRILRGSL